MKKVHVTAWVEINGVLHKPSDPPSPLELQDDVADDLIAKGVAEEAPVTTVAAQKRQASGPSKTEAA